MFAERKRLVRYDDAVRIRIEILPCLEGHAAEAHLRVQAMTHSRFQSIMYPAPASQPPLGRPRTHKKQTCNCTHRQQSTHTRARGTASGNAHLDVSFTIEPFVLLSQTEAASKLTVVAEEYDGHHRRVMR